MIFILTLLVLLLTAFAQYAPYNKVILDNDPEAKCLDGSPAAIYLSEGDPEHILIYMEGGAMCAGDDLSSTV